MKNNLQLVQFESTDNLTLPGLLYEPEGKTKKIALFLHGNGSSSVFYKVDFMNKLGEKLNKNNISFLSFNNRGAQLIHKLTRFKNEPDETRELFGTSHELIKECIYDIDGAVEFLKQLGYEEFYLIGCSTGANKIAVYNYYKESNPLAKYILYSGGDDTGVYYNMFGKEKFLKTLEICKSQIEQGKGSELVSKDILEDVYSYKGLHDVINPDGDYNIFPYYEFLLEKPLAKKELFKELKTIKIPSLILYGSEDEYTSVGTEKAVGILKKELKGDNFEFKIVAGADHGFTGMDDELITSIINFL